MKKPNERVPPPWPEDMEEALMAQRQWLANQRVSPSYRRRSLRSQRARLFAGGALIALLLACFLYRLLKIHY
jgi:hypothetical protein